MVLENSDIDPDRFAIEWVSSAEAPRFAEVVTRFTEKIRALGPNPLRIQRGEPAEASWDASRPQTASQRGDVRHENFL
jgi:F420-non-reducing hydrogenase iron-sulfur subunit